jgi:hypothetical protein
MVECIHAVPRDRDLYRDGCFFEALFEGRSCYTIQQCWRRGELAQTFSAYKYVADPTAGRHDPMTH